MHIFFRVYLSRISHVAADTAEKPVFMSANPRIAPTATVLQAGGIRDFRMLFSRARMETGV